MKKNATLSSTVVYKNWDADSYQQFMLPMLGLPTASIQNPADKAILLQHLDTAKLIAEQLYAVPIADATLELAATFNASLTMEGFIGPDLPGSGLPVAESYSD